jgi:hypothetical protein
MRRQHIRGKAAQHFRLNESDFDGLVQSTVSPLGIDTFPVEQLLVGPLFFASHMRLRVVVSSNQSTSLGLRHPQDGSNQA